MDAVGVAVAVVVVALLALLVAGVATRGRFGLPDDSDGGEDQGVEPSPPTERQLGYIAALLRERRADDLADVDIENVDQASALIDELKSRPRR